MNVPSRAIIRLLIIATAIVAMPSLPHAATPAYHAEIEASAPVLWYQFNEASGAAVNHGTLDAGYDATYFGAPTLEAPTLEGDTGVAFATAADYLESLGDAPAGLTGNPTFSAEALFFVPLGGTCSLWAPFLHWGPSDDSGTTARSVYFSFSNGDPTSAFAGFYNGGLKSASSSLPLGRWHHFIWVRVGGGTALEGTTVYLDGVDVTSTLVPDPNLPADGLTPVVEATAFRVNRARDFDGQRYFTGTLDEVALYDRVLTPQEAFDHYRQAIDEIFTDGFE